MPIPRPSRRPVLAGLVVALALGVLAPLGSSPAGAGAPDQCVTSDAHSFVCDSYASFFRRIPSAAEADYWAPRIPAQKTFFLATLGRAPESRRRMIESYYYLFAEREAGDAEVAYWEGEVLKPNGFRRLETALMTTYEGISYVSFLYEVLTGREPNDGERLYWEGEVALKGRNKVAADIAFTLEARRVRVRWAFLNELGYFPDATSRDYWAERLRTGTSFLDLRIGLKASPDGYPEGTAYCSPLAPYLSNGCI